MTEPTDRELIEGARRGERGAFEALLRQHYDTIYRIAYKWCGNREDAQDITQTACIKLARAIGSFRFESAFVTWLYPLVINTAKDWVKARARHPAAELSEADRSVAPVAEATVYAKQLLERIRALPAREREAITLVFSEGLSHREAARVMACGESTVSWYIHQARQKLQAFRERESRHG